MAASRPIDVDPATTWFTSDNHFGHANIIKYCARPFASLDEMDGEMARRWNTLVRSTDTVFIVGDFSMAKRKAQIRSYADRLHGRKILVRGNHDSREGLGVFAEVHDYLRLRVPVPYPGDGKPVHQLLVLSHFAFEVWDQSHRGSWHLHGHSHGTLPRRGRRMDVGADVHNFAPITFYQVANVLSQVPFEAVDKHGTQDHDRRFAR
jgi:calcineurin-like phosphoesterase family protein